MTNEQRSISIIKQILKILNHAVNDLEIICKQIEIQIQELDKIGKVSQ